jgi:hypothetical protein
MAFYMKSFAQNTNLFSKWEEALLHKNAVTVMLHLPTTGANVN